MNPGATATGRRSALLPALLLGVGALAISLPLTRLWSPTDDEGAMLTGAVKLLHGGIFYRDVAAYPTPGAWYLLAGVMRVGGETLAAARLLTAACFTATVVLCYLLARRVMGPRPALGYGVALLGLKCWAWPAWSAYLYCDVAFPLGVAGALAFVAGWQGGSRRALALGGLFFAAAAWCKQTVGVYPAAGAVVALAAAWIAARRRGDKQAVWAHRGNLLALAGGGLAGALAPALYFTARGLGPEMLAATVIRPFSGYLPLSGVPYAEMLKWWHFGQSPAQVIACYLPAIWSLGYGAHAGPAARAAAEAGARLLYLVAAGGFGVGAVAWAWGRWRGASADSPLPDLTPRPPLRQHRGGEGKRRGQSPAGSHTHDTTGWGGRETVPLPALVVLAGLFASAFPRADYYHLIDVAPAWLLAGCMGAVALACLRPGSRRALAWAGGLLTLAWAIGGLVLMTGLWARCDRWEALPRCGVLRIPWYQIEARDVADYVNSHTRRQTPLFLLGQEAYCYFLADRYSPWPYPQVYPGMTGEEGGEALVAMLRSERVPYIIQGRLKRDDLPPLGAYAPALLAYVQRNYHEIAIPRQGPRLLLTVLESNDHHGR